MTRLLVYSATRGFRHPSIPDGVLAVREIGAGEGIEVDATEDGSVFTEAVLARYAAVVFLNTSGEVLDDAGRSALVGYLAGGGGYLGVHLASGTEYDWPWYGQLVGARFDAHPQIQPARFTVEDRTHPATAHLPARWPRTDELYNFRSNPRSGVRVLMTLDESTYEGGTMGPDHPVTWCHRSLGGPAFYTALGHTPECYAEPEVRALLLGGMRYATGTVQVDDRPEDGYVDVAGTGTEDVDGWAGPGLGTGTVKFAWCDSVEVRLGGRPVPMDGTGAENGPGEWNTSELVVEGGRFVGYLNGVRVLDLELDGWDGEATIEGGTLRRIRRRLNTDRAGSMRGRPGV